MGCHLSKSSNAIHFHADRVDDSIHAMLAREERLARQKGEKPHTYRPRDPHPLLQNGHPKPIVSCEEEDDDKTSVGSLCQSLKKEDGGVEARQQLLLHAKHHCATVDRRDVPVSQNRVIPGTPAF